MTWFKIWYEDTEVIGNSLSDWQNAPIDGVITVYEFFYRDEHGTPYARVSSGSDYYWMTPDEQVGQSCSSSEEPGVWLDCEFPIDAIVKRGKWVSEERLDQVLQETLLMVENGPQI
jgi:hypothetical protein